VISCIGEPAGEVEDALTDEVPIAFGRHRGGGCVEASMIAQSVGCSLGCSHSKLGTGWSHCQLVSTPAGAGARSCSRTKRGRDLRSAAARKAAFDEAEPSSSACVSTRRVRAAPLPHANLSVSVGDPAGPERRYPGTGIPGRLVRPSASAASSNSISGRRPARKAS
jgi:hypothetical protein